MYQRSETSQARWVLTRDGGYVSLRHIHALIPVMVDTDAEETTWQISIRTADLAVRYVHAVFGSRDAATQGIIDLLSGKDFDDLG